VKNYEGMPNFGYYAQGDREEGHHYKLKNFQADRYKQNINQSFVMIGVWSVEDGITECEPDPDVGDVCASPIYNTKDNQPVSIVISITILMDTWILTEYSNANVLCS
jgi:hypothetical protein